MTDDEMKAADAAWDAMPGTPPDGWSFVPRSELEDLGPACIRDRLFGWSDMTHYRLTDCGEEFGDGVWIEVWKERPEKAAEFNPPLTLGSQGAATDD